MSTIQSTPGSLPKYAWNDDQSYTERARAMIELAEQIAKARKVMAEAHQPCDCVVLRA